MIPRAAVLGQREGISGARAAHPRATLPPLAFGRIPPTFPVESAIGMDLAASALPPLFDRLPHFWRDGQAQGRVRNLFHYPTSPAISLPTSELISSMKAAVLASLLMIMALPLTIFSTLCLRTASRTSSTANSPRPPL